MCERVLKSNEPHAHLLRQGFPLRGSVITQKLIAQFPFQRRHILKAFLGLAAERAEDNHLQFGRKLQIDLARWKHLVPQFSSEHTFKAVVTLEKWATPVTM